jgi:hypothetical protein
MRTNSAIDGDAVRSDALERSSKSQRPNSGRPWTGTPAAYNRWQRSGIGWGQEASASGPAWLDGPSRRASRPPASRRAGGLSSSRRSSPMRALRINPAAPGPTRRSRRRLARERRGCPLAVLPSRRCSAMRHRDRHSAAHVCAASGASRSQRNGHTLCHPRVSPARDDPGLPVRNPLQLPLPLSAAGLAVWLPAPQRG